MAKLLYSLFAGSRYIPNWLIRTPAELGRVGEYAAVRFMERRGATIIKRNWRSSAGEIDIIATEGSLLLIVEVKTRVERHDVVPAYHAITPIKELRLRSALERYWATQRRALRRYGVVTPRIDSASVTIRRGRAFSVVNIEYLEGIFDTWGGQDPVYKRMA